MHRPPRRPVGQSEMPSGEPVGGMRTAPESAATRADSGEIDRDPCTPWLLNKCRGTAGEGRFSRVKMKTFRAKSPNASCEDPRVPREDRVKITRSPW